MGEQTPFHPSSIVRRNKGKNGIGKQKGRRNSRDVTVTLSHLYPSTFLT